MDCLTFAEILTVYCLCFGSHKIVKWQTGRQPDHGLKNGGTA